MRPGRTLLRHLKVVLIQAFSFTFNILPVSCGVAPAGCRRRRLWPIVQGADKRVALRVIIADDSVTDRRDIRQSLEATGIDFTGIDARDGAETLELLNRFPADLVICEVCMKPMGGLDLVAELRNGRATPNPNLPVILVCGYLDAYLADLGDLVDSDELLTRPVNPDVLRARILSVLRKSRPG